MKPGRTAAAVEVYQELENNYRQALSLFADDVDEQYLNAFMHRLLGRFQDHIHALAKDEQVSAVELFEMEEGRACPLK
jgi:hypothetical protein